MSCGGYASSAAVLQQHMQSYIRFFAELRSCNTFAEQVLFAGTSGRVEQVRVVLERPRAVRWSMGPDFRNNGFLRKKGLEGSAVGQEHTCAAPPYQALWTVRAGRCMEASS